MARSRILTKEERVKKEEKRLLKILAAVDPTKKNVVQGLVQRAAHLRITLDELAVDLDENGYTEMFQQGRDNPPYSRKRPSADLYVSMNAQYQKVTKQLLDLLPKETAQTRKAAEGDMFEEFINDRDD